jgi:hypothetical protein
MFGFQGAGDVRREGARSGFLPSGALDLAAGHSSRAAGGKEQPTAFERYSAGAG